MAGVVRAVARNGFGIAGIAPGGAGDRGARVHAGRAGASDECRLYDVLRGVDLAWNQGATVMNLSLVGPDNPLLERAMSRLEKLGALVVAAAGNEGTREPRYPAAYPSVIGVGALDADGKRLRARQPRRRPPSSSRPASRCSRRVPGDAFAFGDGTSLAAAHVSGALAVLAPPRPTRPRAHRPLPGRRRRPPRDERPGPPPPAAAALRRSDTPRKPCP